MDVIATDSGYDPIALGQHEKVVVDGNQKICPAGEY